jgi:hypothetical protein
MTKTHKRQGIDMDPFTRIFVDAYITAALWSSMDDNGDPLDDGNYELSSETRDLMTAEASAFFQAHRDLIDQTPEGYGYENAGHDLWLTRCGHGAGFWDGDAGDVGDELSELAKALGDQHIYVGDDDQLYIY